MNKNNRNSIEYFYPEPIESMRTRFQDVVNTPFDSINSLEIPANLRKYCFDFGGTESLRLIISFTKLPNDPEAKLYVSCSMSQQSRYVKQLIKLQEERKDQEFIDTYASIATELFERICDFPCTLKPIAMTRIALHLQGPSLSQFVQLQIMKKHLKCSNIPEA